MNYTEIVMPLILAYADDIILVSGSLNMLETVFKELRSARLEINDNKCNILIREPGNEAPIPPNIVLNGVNIQVVTIMKYLGIYITSE